MMCSFLPIILYFAVFQDKVNLAFGDMHNKQINSRVFNSLRNFSRIEAKRHHKLKDKVLFRILVFFDHTFRKIDGGLYRAKFSSSTVQ